MVHGPGPDYERGLGRTQVRRVSMRCSNTVGRRTNPSKMCGAIGSKKVSILPTDSSSAHAFEQLTISGLAWHDVVRQIWRTTWGCEHRCRGKTFRYKLRNVRPRCAINSRRSRWTSLVQPIRKCVKLIQKELMCQNAGLVRNELMNRNWTDEKNSQIWPRACRRVKKFPKSVTSIQTGRSTWLFDTSRHT